MTGITKNDLSQFTGTQQYYRHWTNKIVFTDGIKYLADKTGGYWFIDVVASYQDKLKNIPFQLWKIKVNPDKTAVITVKGDSNTPVIIKQELEYTDFPFDLEVYCINDGSYTVLLLKSEY